MEMNTPRKFLSFIVIGLLLVLFVSCQTDEQLPALTSTKTPVPTATLTSTPTPLPAQIQYLRDNPHAGPIPEGAIAALGRGTIIDLAYSPQSNQMVIASSIGLYVYQAPDFELIHFESLQIGFVGEAEFSDDGSLLAVVTETTDLLIFDVVSWEVDLNVELLPDDMAFYFGDIAFSLENNFLFLILEWPQNSPSKLLVYDLSTGNQVVFEEGRFTENGVAFSIDGSMLAIGLDKGVKIVDLKSGNIKYSSEGLRNWGRVRFSSNGKYLTSWNLRYIYIYDVAAEVVKELFSFREEIDVIDVKFSRDGEHLIVITPEGLQIWDVEARKQVSQTELLLGDKPSLFLFSEAQILISGKYRFFFIDIEDFSSPQIDGTVSHSSLREFRVNGIGDEFLAWESSGGRLVALDLVHKENIELGTFESEPLGTKMIIPGSNYLFTYSTNQARVWSLPEREPYKSFEGFNSHFTQDILYNWVNNFLVTSGANENVLTVWDIETQEIIRRYWPNDTWTRDLSRTPNEDIILVRAAPISVNSPRLYDLYLWDLTMEQPPLLFIDHYLNTFDVRPIEESFPILWFTVPKIFSEGSFTVWDLNTQELVSTLDVESQGWSSAGFSEGRSTLFLADAEHVVTIDVETGKITKSVKLHHDQTNLEVFSFGVVLLPKVGKVVTLAVDRGNHTRWLLTWDLDTGQLLEQMELSTTNSRLNDHIVFSEDCIVISETAGKDMIWIWNLSTEELITSIQQPGVDLGSAQFLPGTNLLATASINGPVVLWDLPPLCE